MVELDTASVAGKRLSEALTYDANGRAAMITKEPERTRALRRRGDSISQPGRVRLNEIFRDNCHVRSCTRKGATAPCLRRVLTGLAWPGRPRVGVGLCSIRGNSEIANIYVFRGIRISADTTGDSNARTLLAHARAQPAHVCNERTGNGQRTNGSLRVTHKVLSHSGTLRAVFTL